MSTHRTGRGQAPAWLRRLAGGAPVPVCVVEGVGGYTPVRRLRLDSRLELVRSPRHATVLLVIGAVPADHAPALRRLHDQLAHPRAALWWTGESLGETARQTLPEAVETADDPIPAAVDLHRSLLAGDRQTSSALGPRDNPTDWQGIGPHGQGGEGMMGGTPYGRPMAMTGEDIRDGLALDRVRLTVGPYHTSLPAGLALDLELQGDVIVTCRAHASDSTGGALLGAPPRRPEPPPDPLLLWLADLLGVHGLDAVCERVLRAAFEPTTGGHGSLITRARRALIPCLRGVGTIDGEDALGRLDRRLAVDGVRPDPNHATGNSSGDLAVLDDHLPGVEWGRAVTTIWSLGPWLTPRPEQPLSHGRRPHTGPTKIPA